MQNQNTEETPFETYKKSLSRKCKVVDRENKKYDKVKRVFNGVHNSKNPLFVVQPITTSDVVKTVNYARENNLLLTARGGGHSFAGYSIVEDGIVVDFSKMRAIVVDPKEKTAVVQMGLLGSDLDLELSQYNLYCVSGTVSHTGIGGLMLHGGFGLLVNSSGFSLKSILEIEVVVASGEVLICNENQNKDLFWALKGSPSNFGIVTRMKLQCHEFRNKNATLYSSVRVYPPTEFANVNKFVQKIIPNLSEKVLIVRGLAVMNGNKVTMLVSNYNGSQEEAEKELEQIFSYGTPLMVQSGLVPYTIVQKSLDHLYPHGKFYYEKAAMAETLTDEFFDIAQSKVLESDIDYNFTFLVASLTHHSFDSTGGCFSLQDAKSCSLVISDIAIKEGDHETYDKACLYIKSTWESLAGTYKILPVIYLNFMMEEDLKQTEREKIFGKSSTTLKDIKSKYDPKNVFRNSIKNLDLVKN